MAGPSEEENREPERFQGGPGTDAQQRFQRWQTDNERGFYINFKTKTSGMLHRVKCHHVGLPEDHQPEFGDLTRREKRCHVDRKRLIEWAAKDGIIVTFCADCDPQSDP